jgi:hypothetical protein
VRAERARCAIAAARARIVGSRSATAASSSRPVQKPQQPKIRGRGDGVLEAIDLARLERDVTLVGGHDGIDETQARARCGPEQEAERR